jgi:anaerobic magnesium-protoporphyrin IX monomethyl ester cyclase
LKNVVLLQPKIGDMDQFRDRPTPPMGLLTAMSMFDPGLEVRVVDQRLDRGWRARVVAAVDADTVAAGVTTLTGGMILHALDMAAEVRRVSEIPIVWGGVHPSLLPGQTIEHPLVDYLVQGEGEAAFAALIRALAAGRGGEGIPGVWYQIEGRVEHTPRATLMGMDELPPAPYGAIDMEPYIGRFQGQRMLSYQTSRGCPYSCRYCYNSVYNLGRWRAMDPERVIAELAELRQTYDVGVVYLLDDNFFIHKARAMRILEGLRALGLRTVLQGVDVETFAALSDDELSFIERAGVMRVSVGVESGDDRVRAELLNKRGDLALLKQQLRRLAGRELRVLTSFVIGFPGETLDEIRASVDLAMWTLRLGDNYRMPVLYNYVPYPGTPTFNQLRDEGFPFPETLDGWGAYEWEKVIVSAWSDEIRDYLERVTFISRFLDRKDEDFGFGHHAMRAAYRLYRPLAWLRMSRGLLRPLPERALYHQLRDRVAP